MISAKDLMNELMEGEEYVSAMMPIQIFHQIQDELQSQMYFTIRQKSCQFDTDEIHCGLIKAISKAKRKLRDYEFELNNK